jgi:hypothetical protein
MLVKILFSITCMAPAKSFRVGGKPGIFSHPIPGLRIKKFWEGLIAYFPFTIYGVFDTKQTA